MSIVQENSRYPIFTLRKHTDPITAIAFVRIPLTTQTKLIIPPSNTTTATEHQNSPETNTICKPYVVTADEKGNLKLWDLKTHRTIIEIDHAHKGSVLSVKQLGTTYKEEDATTVIDPALFGYCLTHSRDHTIKFWRLLDDKGAILFKEIYEMPVNSLNFSNVDSFDHYLVSPNTSDSNKFDIYDLNFLYMDNAKHLTRVFEAVDLLKECKIQGHEFHEFNLRAKQDDDLDNVNRVDKFGIVMKYLWIKKDLIAVGYESGHVVIVQCDLDTKKLKILQVSAYHFPNPVLSISYNQHENTLLSSSIKSKIVKHDLSNFKSEPTSVKVQLNKISNIITYQDRLILSSWSGLIKFFKSTKTTDSYEEISQFNKPKGMLIGNLNIIGNNQSNDIEIQKQYIVKPNTLEVFIQDQKEIGVGYQRILERRDMMLLKKNFLCVGYDDGTVMVYDDI